MGDAYFVLIFWYLQLACEGKAIGEDGGGVVYGASEEAIDCGAAAAHGGIGGAHVVERLLNGGYLRIAAEDGGLKVVDKQTPSPLPREGGERNVLY